MELPNRKLIALVEQIFPQGGAVVAKMPLIWRLKGLLWLLSHIPRLWSYHLNWRTKRTRWLYMYSMLYCTYCSLIVSDVQFIRGNNAKKWTFSGGPRPGHKLFSDGSLRNLKTKKAWQNPGKMSKESNMTALLMLSVSGMPETPSKVRNVSALDKNESWTNRLNTFINLCL